MEIQHQSLNNEVFVNPLKALKLQHPDNPLLSYVNVNSIRNKLDSLTSIALENVDILCVAESKLDSSFPNALFSVQDFKCPIRLDVSNMSGGLLLFIRESLSTRLLKCPNIPFDIQCISIELNMHNRKWLIMFVYRNPKQDLNYFLDELANIMDFYSRNYENFIIVGDFNETCLNTKLSSFMTTQSLKSLITTPTCFKSDDGRCIDLILTNRPSFFQKSNTFETGVSDHHHLIYTMLKSRYIREPPKMVRYRNYRNFSSTKFETDLVSALSETQTGDFSSFTKTIEDVLNTHAPYKSKVLRGNHKPHITKAMRKAIMLRSFYKNRFNKTKDQVFYDLYKKQRNAVVSMNKKAKRSFFHSLSKNSKEFWSNAKPFFSSKTKSKEKISLLEGDKHVSDDSQLASIFNNYYVNIVKELNIVPWDQSDNNKKVDTNDDIESIISYFHNHPSILEIQSQNYAQNTFSFSHIEPQTVYRTIKNLNRRKAVSGSIPIKIIQDYIEILYIPLTDCLNNSILDTTFPSALKLSRVSPIYKNGEKTCKTNYRPISVLPVFSKVYERILHDQLSSHFEKIFSPKLCGFRKGHSTQHALLNMLNEWYQTLDNSGIVGTILMDLSKAFDSLNHDLLIAKLAAYGVDPYCLKFLRSYLSNRFQRTKIGSSFSEWLEVLLGVPQGSILGPLLFNIFINDLLIVFERFICNFADDNTIFSCGESTEEVISHLKSLLHEALKWFSANMLVVNPKKFQMMFLGCPSVDIQIKINNDITLHALDTVKLLGVTIDNKLSFKTHVANLCQKATQSIRSFNRIRRYLNVDQCLLLLNSYILSAFSYAPILWMFGSKSSSKAINDIHKRALRIVYGTSNGTLHDLLKTNNLVRIHELHLRQLLCEIFKIMNMLNPPVTRDLFKVKDVTYTLRINNLVIVPKVKTTSFGTNTFRFRGSLLWNSLPDNLKLAESVNQFKVSLKNCELTRFCTCNQC